MLPDQIVHVPAEGARISLQGRISHVDEDSEAAARELRDFIHMQFQRLPEALTRRCAGLRVVIDLPKA